MLRCESRVNITFVILTLSYFKALYRHAVYTIEGVHADAIFSYQPPLNLIALFVMVPAGYIITPRWFHKVSPIFICHLPV